MTTARIARGRRTEEVVAEYLRTHGWPDAERVPASLPGADIRNTVDIAVEVKARSDLSPLAWQRQAEANADGRLPFVVFRSNGQGENVGEYLSLIRTKDLIVLLQEAGYGDGEQVA